MPQNKKTEIESVAVLEYHINSKQKKKSITGQLVGILTTKSNINLPKICSNKCKSQGMQALKKFLSSSISLTVFLLNHIMIKKTHSKEQKPKLSTQKNSKDQKSHTQKGFRNLRLGNQQQEEPNTPQSKTPTIFDPTNLKTLQKNKNKKQNKNLKIEKT